MAEPSAIPTFENDPVLVLFLSIVTCGLYLIYWNIKTAEVINAVTGRPHVSQSVAIMSGCCIPVNAYFYYLCGQALPDLGRLLGDDTLASKATLLLVPDCWASPAPRVD
jgi:hypothetical protein